MANGCALAFERLILCSSVSEEEDASLRSGSVPDPPERRASSCHSHAAWRVMAEPFKRWVIEDHFIYGRPRWEQVGAPMTSNVLRTKR
jgi:hypothetical protein